MKKQQNASWVLPEDGLHKVDWMKLFRSERKSSTPKTPEKVNPEKSSTNQDQSPSDSTAQS